MSRELKADVLELQQRLIDLGVDEVVLSSATAGYNLAAEMLNNKLDIEFSEMPDAQVQGRSVLYVKVSINGGKGIGFYAGSLDGIVEHIQDELDGLNRPKLPDFRKMTGLDHG